jgi:hypothetical protein|tara:strand:+ start:134 stop:352 length:219 start_codon:yes stop_codon:yes gene_type:complete
MAAVTEQSTTIKSTTITAGSLRDLLTEAMMHLPVYEREIAYVTLSTTREHKPLKPDEDGWKFTIGWKAISNE